MEFLSNLKPIMIHTLYQYVTNTKFHLIIPHVLFNRQNGIRGEGGIYREENAS